MSTEPKTPAVQPQSAGGFMTQAREQGIPPAVLAEQQRAKTEIEAALTIAASMPRDEKHAMDKIVISCQREGLAEKAQYQYSRGGTAISGASIVLMEAIAQRWGNIDFGFRELSRYPARGNQPGQSVIEAYAWDLETNIRRKVQFVVEHAMKAGGKIKQLTDPRDIYEYVANQSQRRVRTCLENIIPRDIVETACRECDETLKAQIKDVADSAKKMLQAFVAFDVTQAMVEGRIQRHIAAITPAQIIGLRKIYTSIKDGMSEAGDWFDADVAEEETAAEKAKKAMREKSAKAKATKAEAADPPPAPTPTPETKPKPAPPSPPSEPAPLAPQGTKERQPIQAAIDQAFGEIRKENDPGKITLIDATFTAREDVDDRARRLVHATAEGRIEELKFMPQEAEPPAEPLAPPEVPEPAAADYKEQVAQWLVDLDVVETVRGLKQALAAIPAVWPESARQMITAKINTKIDGLVGTKQGG